MAEVTRVHGFGQVEAGTVYYPGNVKAFLITVNDGSSAVDLRTLDDEADEAVENIMREVQAIAYFVHNDGADGKITVICDGTQTEAADLQARIRGLSRNGVSGKDFDGTTVSAAATIKATA